MPSFYEFFAGGGMVRAGLGRGWTCLFANDFDRRKAAAYEANWGDGGELTVADVRNLGPEALPGRADLVWGSFPCQDLSLAGGGAGLKGARSGAFHGFWALLERLMDDGRAPAIIALENVVGTLTSHGGADFEAICGAFARARYRYGALVINASLFVPQSRPRLFIVGVREDLALDPALLAPGPAAPFHTPALRRAFDRLAGPALDARVWWNVPAPARRNATFADILEDEPDSVSWHGEVQRDRILGMMSPVNRAKVEAAKRAGRRMVGGIYRRTRRDAAGQRIQRAEVRFDDIAGCLRTPAGGSSRQLIVVVDGPQVRTRLISARETARLMGLDDSYRLPSNYNEAYHLTGDGVAVHVVRHLAEHLFEPLLGLGARARSRAAA